MSGLQDQISTRLVEKTLLELTSNLLPRPLPSASPSWYHFAVEPLHNGLPGDRGKWPL